MVRAMRAKAAVLLAPLLHGSFNFARGSFSSQDAQVSSNPMLDYVHEGLQQVQHTWNGKIISSIPMGATTDIPVGGEIRRDDAKDTHALFSDMVGLHDSTIKRRKLQQSDCANGTSSISVTSTVFPLMEGCFNPDVTDGFVSYWSGTSCIIPSGSTITAEMVAICICENNNGTSSISVTSTVFPPMEGCFDPDVTDGFASYWSGTSCIIPSGSTIAVEPIVWYAINGDCSTVDFTPACLSMESPDDVDPTLATWLCDADGDGLDYTLANEELVVVCGCSVESPTPSSVVSNPTSSTAASTCGERESFFISSEDLPETEGCYIDTEVTFNENPVYTASGTLDVGQIRMVAVEFTPEDADTIILWALVYLEATTSNADNQFYCTSEEEAGLHHPSEVPNWICEMETTTISVDCGCSSSSPLVSPTPVLLPTAQPVLSTVSPVVQFPTSPTTQPAESSGPLSTLTPVAPASDTGTTSTGVLNDDGNYDATAAGVAKTCPGDGSFTISANAAPKLAGCYQDTGNTDVEGSLFYTVSGTTNGDEAVLFSLLTDDGDFYWFIAYIPVNDESSEDGGVYCISQEAASSANPGDASWNCDFVSNGESFSPATEDDISITCGSCADSVVAEDTSMASKLLVGGVTAGYAGIIAAASACGNW